MKRFVRLAFVFICVGLLVWALAREQHAVRSFGTTQPAEVDGMTFVEGSTYDAYLRIGDELFDAQSLTPGTAQEKDCKT